MQSPNESGLPSNGPAAHAAREAHELMWQVSAALLALALAYCLAAAWLRQPQPGMQNDIAPSLIEATMGNGGGEGGLVGATLSDAHASLLLNRAILNFESRGYSLGFELVGIDDGRSFSYHADEEFYGASSIKGPYVIALYDEMVDGQELDAGAVEPLAQEAIVYSDNESYLSLRNAYGSSFFLDWMDRQGIVCDTYASLPEYADAHFPYTSCQQLVSLWRVSYDYLEGGGTNASLLRGWFENRETSPIKQALGGSCETISKAGWMDAAENGVEPATIDAGIIYAPDGAYLLAVASNAPEDFDALASLIATIDSVHTQLI